MRRGGYENYHTINEWLIFCHDESKCLLMSLWDHVVLFPSDVPLVSTLVSAPYSGCLEVSVNGQSLDLDQAIYKHNDIHSHSCPLLDLNH